MDNEAQRRLQLAAAAVGVAVLALLCWRFGLATLATACAHVSPARLLSYVALGCLVRLGYALRWRLVSRTLGKSPPLAQLLAARLAGDAVGALLPTGRIAGDPVRVALVYGDGGGGVRATAGVTIDRIIELTANMVAAIAYVGVFSAAYTLGAPHRAAVGLLAGMIFLLLALGVPLAMLRCGVRPLEPFYWLAERAASVRWRVWTDALRATEGQLMQFFREHPGSFLQGLVASLGIEALIIAEYYVLLAAFGVTLDLPLLLMALVVSGVARAVPTPAGLGALEGSQVTLLAVAARQASVGFVVGMVLRLHETLWMAVGFGVLAWRGVPLKRLGLLASADRAV